jgi:hypothetical protein
VGEEEEDLLAPVPQAVTAAASLDSSTLLETLRVEPHSDAERQERFSTFETFSDAVTGLRQQLDDVVTSALQSLPPGEPRDDVQRSLRKLDSADNTGIHDQSRNWFVYDMAKQAIDNCTRIRKLSETIAAKVKFAAESIQENCPICMEPFAPATTTPSATATSRRAEEGADEPPAVLPKMLSCCHVVCETCWANWIVVNHGRPFCPLCRNEEFVGVVFSAGQ